jgi:hypothetical protein
MAGEWIEGKARGLVAQFFPGEWEETGGCLQGRCPAEGTHTGRSAKTDARIFLAYGAGGETPGCYCLHHSCKGVLDDLNGKFREAIFARDGKADGSRAAGAVAEPGVVARAPRDREPGVPEFAIGKLRGMVMAQTVVKWDWFEKRSPVPVGGLGPGDFLERVFQPGERVLVFTSFFSQGEYLWEVGRGGFRLGEKPGIKAVRSELPRDGKKEGIWYLCQPVDAQWHANERRGMKESRRSEESVTRWRNIVLECDEEKTLRKRGHALEDAAKASDPDAAWEALVKGGGAKWAEAAYTAGDWAEQAKRYHAEAAEVPGLWLRFLAMVPLAIVAIYSSGGHSLHALVRVDQPDKPTFDTLLRENIKRTLPVIGADPGALTPVRLTRLPGCTRGGNEQRLIYLNPSAHWAKPVAISSLPALR